MAGRPDNQLLQQAIALARAGEYAQARTLLIALLRQDAGNVEAWFWLACVTESPWEAWSALRKVEELAPGYPGARQGIAWVQEAIDAGRRLAPMSVPYAPRPAAATQPPAPTPKRRDTRWLRNFATALFIVALILGAAGALWTLFVAGEQPAAGAQPAPASATPMAAAPTPTPAPTATAERPRAGTWEEAWANGDWAAAIAFLENLSAQDPANSVWRSRLFDAHVRLGNQYAENGQVKQALAEYDTALALRPYDAELQQTRGLATRYLGGLERFQAGDWAGAIDILLAIYNTEGDYRETRDLLYSSYYNLALAHQANGRLDDAEQAYRQAGAFASDENKLEIERRLAQVKDLKTPPTPTPSPKKIIVDLSEQRLYAYEDDRLVYSFICSTGSNASPTAPGTYRVLDKIPMAYASTWNLQMPFWLGIYWSGTLENGIHALPILSNGRILWDGFLGQRVSFGCVILSRQAAEIIYNWVDIGTPVIIRP